MSDSVRKGGSVSGPAPLENNPDVVALSSARSARQRQEAGSDIAAPPESNNGKEPDLSIAVARASLSNALKSQRHLEARLEKVCSSLLIAGEQIPTLDQGQLSMLQEAYMNASIAASVATEKTLIWRARVDRLSAKKLSRPQDNDDYLMAA
jgi:hypothetical protein